MSIARHRFENFADQFIQDGKELGDPFLRAIQQRFDEVRFRRVYPGETGGVSAQNARIFHIGKHIGKALGKFNSLLEARGPRQVEKAKKVIFDQVLPDTLIYRTQLANTLRVDMKARLKGLEPSQQGIDELYYLLGRTRSMIDGLDERSDHYKDVPPIREHIRRVGIPLLHITGITLASQFDIEPRAAHLWRLIYLNEQPDML